MSNQLISKRRADQFAAGIFFLLLGAIAYYDLWWPGIMAAIGIVLVIRYSFLRKWYDAFIALLVFGGIFVTIQFNLSWMPVIFIVAGIYLLFRFATTADIPESEEEEEEEIQKELEEEAPLDKDL